MKAQKTKRVPKYQTKYWKVVPLFAGSGWSITKTSDNRTILPIRTYVKSLAELIVKEHNTLLELGR
jgi:hypothetical protein